MRLFEVDNSLVDNLTLKLRNLILRGDSKYSPQELTYDALSNLIGFRITQSNFQALFDQNPNIQKYIATHDDDGVVLATQKDLNAPKDKFDVPVGPSVDQMASSGAKSHLQNISK